MPIQTINPATGRLLRSFDALTEPEIRARIGVAGEAFQQYVEVPLEHRALWMRKLAAILEQEVDELAATITTEMGKTLVAARQEVLKCAACCRFYADNAARILAEEEIPVEGQKSFVRWEPLGVVLAVMPWNFPFWQVFRFLAPALMAGNVTLLKHASNVPQCALSIQSLVRRSGFPRGTFQALLIEAHQVDAVLADPRVSAVTVTGSETAGRAVAAQAGWLLKKSVLELGGSDPFIVMPSADLERAVEVAVKSRCINNGQSCIAAKRFIVHEDVYKAFEVRFVAAMEALTIGDPMRESTDVGPLATVRLLQDLQAQVEAAVSSGATVLCGGEPMLGEGNFFEPTVLAGVPRTAAVYQDELFGPVAMLFPAASLEQAIEIANDTPFGLAASVWTRDGAERDRLIAELACGAVFVNSMVASDPRLPFGGIKRSGYGRELSSAGMREFLNAKTVVIAEAAQQHRIAFEAPAPAPGPELDPEPESDPELDPDQEFDEPEDTPAPVDSGEFSKAFQNALKRQS